MGRCPRSIGVRDRSASAIGRRADNEVVCYALPMEEFDALDRTDPKMKATLLENILPHVSTMLRRVNQEVSALAR